MNNKAELIDEFRRYLDAQPQKSRDNARLDLFSFYSELIGLKNEIKIESRQVKKGLDEFRLAVSRTEESNHKNLQTIIDHIAIKIAMRQIFRQKHYFGLCLSACWIFMIVLPQPGRQRKRADNLFYHDSVTGKKKLSKP